MKSSIRQYLLQVGHQVKEFDPLLEVQSDKANVEITSPYNGIIEKLYGTGGDMIQVCRGAHLRLANCIQYVPSSKCPADKSKIARA